MKIFEPFSDDWFDAPERMPGLLVPYRPGMLCGSGKARMGADALGQPEPASRGVCTRTAGAAAMKDSTSAAPSVYRGRRDGGASP